jgi:hypothetical protein
MSSTTKLPIIEELLKYTTYAGVNSNWNTSGISSNTAKIETTNRWSYSNAETRHGKFIPFLHDLLDHYRLGDISLTTPESEFASAIAALKTMFTNEQIRAMWIATGHSRTDVCLKTIKRWETPSPTKNGRYEDWVIALVKHLDS